MAYVVREAKNFYDLMSASQRSKKAGGIVPVEVQVCRVRQRDIILPYLAFCLFRPS